MFLMELFADLLFLLFILVSVMSSVLVEDILVKEVSLGSRGVYWNSFIEVNGIM